MVVSTTGGALTTEAGTLYWTLLEAGLPARRCTISGPCTQYSSYSHPTSWYDKKTKINLMRKKKIPQICIKKRLKKGFKLLKNKKTWFGAPHCGLFAVCTDNKNGVSYAPIDVYLLWMSFLTKKQILLLFVKEFSLLWRPVAVWSLVNMGMLKINDGTPQSEVSVLFLLCSWMYKVTD